MVKVMFLLPDPHMWCVLYSYLIGYYLYGTYYTPDTVLSILLLLTRLLSKAPSGVRVFTDEETKAQRG